MLDFNFFIFNGFFNVVMFEIYMFYSAMEYRIPRHCNCGLVITKKTVTISYFSSISFNIFFNQTTCFVTLSCFFDAHKNTPDQRVIVYLDVLFMSSMLPAQSLSQKLNNSTSSFSFLFKHEVEICDTLNVPKHSFCNSKMCLARLIHKPR
jgi:hypothetical protein